ncbi:MAG TPA: hypothetical protein VLA97_17070 [Nocardioidaceae bacterium]|jgi:hypothetical protein|nr:hypothetical protein [Nocardioidaceae bacterium]
MSSDDGRLVVPRLTSRSAIGWFVGTMVVAAAVVGYLTATQPENRWTLWVIVPLFLLLVLAVLSQACWVDTGTGTVVWRRWWRRSTLTLSRATGVELVTDRGGALLLSLRGPEQRSARYLPVLALTTYVEKSQPPQVLEGLAGQLERWSTAQVYGRVPRELRDQARWVASGGDPKDSPLAGRVGHGISRAAGAGGAVGGGSGLLS